MKGIQIGTEIVSTVFTVGGFTVAAAIIISVITTLCGGKDGDKILSASYTTTVFRIGNHTRFRKHSS